MSEPVLTIANVLTLLRMGLVPFLVILLIQGRFNWALATLVVAGLTDLFDGMFARRAGSHSTLGAMLDPVADKILLSASFIALTWGNLLVAAIPKWLTVIVLSRDAIIVISVLIINLTVGRRVFYPSFLGKTSTICQIVTVGVVILCNALAANPPFLFFVYLLTSALTVASALHYVYLAAIGHSGVETP